MYLPIFTLEGIEGKMFKPMAQTVAFALLGAFILSLTYVPMISAIFLSKKINVNPNFSDKLMMKIENLYANFFNKIMQVPKLVLGCVIAVFLLSILVMSFLGGEFIPRCQKAILLLDTRVLTGSNSKTRVEAQLRSQSYWQLILKLKR